MAKRCTKFHGAFVVKAPSWYCAKGIAYLRQFVLLDVRHVALTLVHRGIIRG